MDNQSPDFVILSDYQGTIDIGGLNTDLLNDYADVAKNYNVQVNIITARYISHYHNAANDKFACEWYLENLMLPYHIDKRIYYADGLVEIGGDKSRVIAQENFDRSAKDVFAKISARSNLITDKLILIDDTGINRRFAKEAGCMVADPVKEDELRAVFDLVKQQATKRAIIETTRTDTTFEYDEPPF